MLSDLSVQALAQLEADLFYLLDDSLTTCYYGGMEADELTQQIEETLRAVTELRRLVEASTEWV